MEKIKRPVFLSAFCILTFIGSTVAFLSYFLASVFFEKTAEIIIKYSSWSSVEQISPIYFTVFMVLYALSLIGAIRMWKRHRNGFYIYSLAQLVILLLPVVWVNGQSFSVTNAIFTGIFIAGYGWHWSWLK